MENKRAIRQLFHKYLAGKTSTAETNELLRYFATDQGSELLDEFVNEKFDEGVEVDAELLMKIQPLMDRVGSKLNLLIHKNDKPKPIRKLRLLAIATAAAITIALGTVIIYKYSKEATSSGPSLAVIDAEPGSNKAVLILSNGTQIDLNHAKNGELAKEAGMIATKNQEGEITYNMAERSTSADIFNTLKTPNGGTYMVRLPDGSKVWLNAASSLKYPISFLGRDERKVELSGEAYFEVAHNSAQPFRVVSGDQTVEVLGTHFNINSYSNESQIITTLEEGSVKVSSKTASQLIKPGQRSINHSGNINLESADMETTLAWKNGNIIFKSASVEEIMRQVERWYDVKVSYEGKPSKRLFSGGISRTSKLSVLLSVLKDSGINFELKQGQQGKTLTIKQ